MKNKNFLTFILIIILISIISSCNKIDINPKARMNYSIHNFEKIIGTPHELIQIANMKIPNLWGIIPGKTSWKTVNFLIQDVSESVIGPYFIQDEIGYTVNYYDSINDESFSIIFYCDENYIVQEIIFPTLF